MSLATVTVSLLYLLGIISGLPEGSLQLTPDPSDGSSWLLYLHIDWIERFGIALEMAMDGLSLLLVVLTLLLGLVAIASSWSEIEFRPGLFQANLLWTLAGVCGVFLAMDLFLFFLFWEVMLIPMYLLIAIWGHERKAYASMKFFLFTQISGLFMLLSILTLVSVAEDILGEYTFNTSSTMVNAMGQTSLAPGVILSMLGTNTTTQLDFSGFNHNPATAYDGFGFGAISGVGGYEQPPL